MATKVAILDDSFRQHRDYKKFLYFIDKNGNVCRKQKHLVGQDDVEGTEILINGAVIREPKKLYFIDRDGDVSMSERKQKQEAAV